MKNTFILLSLLFTLFNCQKETPPTESYEFDIRPVGENDVIIEWVNNDANNTIKFTIDTDDQFEDPVVTSELEASHESVTLTGLSPLTHYFMKIEIMKNQEITWTETIDFTSMYTSEAVKYGSTDNVELCANFGYISSSLSTNSKVVIFMHEFTKSKSRWYVTGLVDTLIKDGNLCVAIDFRGHGCSSFDDDVLKLIEEPWLLREDFDATLDFLRTIDLEHSSEIIVLGASMGACVATATSSYDNIIGGVAASAVENLSRQMYDGTITPKGMFYIAGELDKNEGRGIYYEKDANSLYNATVKPAKVVIVEGTAEHGVDLLESNPELVTEALEWVRAL